MNNIPKQYKTTIDKMTSIAALIKGLLLTGVFILLSILRTNAATGTTQWNRGNQLYQQKQYDSALAYFEQVAAAHPGIAEVYYNIGNTYYKLNKVAPAVLNYERALHINPDYKEAKENLLLTQSRISNHIQPVNDIFFIAWWQQLTTPALANMWSILALATFVMIVLIMTANRFRKKGGIVIPGQVTGILTFVLICIMILAVAAAKNVTDSKGAVVMVHDAPLMNADLKGKPASLVPEGTTVKIKATNGDYAEVTLPDGRRGWMQLSGLTKI